MQKSLIKIATIFLFVVFQDVHAQKPFEQLQKVIKQHEVELITHTIKDLIPPPPLPNYFDLNSEEERENARKKWEDTITFSIYLSDTLHTIRHIDIKHQHFYHSNKTMFDLLLKFHKPGHINLTDIEELSSFKLIKSQNEHYFYSKINGSLYIGEVSYSRILFNKDFSKAMFCFKYVCGGLCGLELFVQAKKVEGIWKVGKTRILWIS